MLILMPPADVLMFAGRRQRARGRRVEDQRRAIRERHAAADRPLARDRSSGRDAHVPAPSEPVRFSVPAEIVVLPL